MTGGAPRGVVVVPRWSGTAADDWYPWLADELDVDVRVCGLDVPDAPTVAGSVLALGEVVREHDPAVLVGHSVGCQVVLRHLAATRRPVPAVVLVAAWLDVDEPWDTLRPWIDVPIDVEAVRAAAGRIHVLVSTDDPFTADHAATRDAFVGSFGADVTVVEAAAHFNAAREPRVADAVRAALASV